MIWLLAHPLYPSPASISTSDTDELRKRENLLTGWGGERGWAIGAESYDRKRAWSSINHLISLEL
jgi:hypothetical protein